ncbi:KAP family P-loop NTPase fold protein [Thomasclavelia spiroformis]|uniref:KAP family P-loop NTPase fold protein n=1 Tax=Thomasclavelia spiroformis TaxID=29348 RepID=UPI003209BCD1
MLSPDLPITKATEDTLNRGSFAKSLAKTILQYSFSSSFTIGLYGEWGSGKTSLVNMVLEYIENIDETIVILRFNPWLCSDPKQLIIQFFKQMATAIKLKKPSSEKAWKLIDQYADIFDVASLIPGAGPIGSIVAVLGKALAKGANERIGQRSTDLQESKNQIINKLKEENLKIVVSIDDIDRLSEEEIIATFQLVKSLADFPNTVYILAFDYDVVVRALSRVQHGDGKEYLEKIIQVPFEIPAPSIEKIHDALFTKLKSILGGIPEDRWDKTTWGEIFQFGLKNYIKSIRDVIRYTNVFMLKYELLKEETDPVDLLGLTALQVFEPSVYAKLPSYKDTLCGANHSYSFEQQKDDEEKMKKVVSLIIPNDGTISNLEAANNILGILFPRTKTTTGLLYSIGRYYSHHDFFMNNNIAVPECFERYFALVLENDAIPTNIIKRLIYESNEDEFNQGVIQLYKEGKIIRLFDEIAAYANGKSSVVITAQRASLIIKVLSRNWSSFEVDDRDYLSVPFAWRFLFCIDPLLKVMDSTSRFSCMYSIFADEDVQPSTLALLLQDFETQLGRFTKEARRKDDAIFGEEEVFELESIFKNRAIKAIDSGDALKQHQGLNFFWMLGQLDEELVTNKKKTLISDDISLVKVISYCTSRGTELTKKGAKIREVNQKTLGEFINIDAAYQRIKKFVVTSQFFSLPEDDKMNAVAFILISERMPSESIKKNHIEEESIIKKLKQLENQFVNSNVISEDFEC